MAIYTVTAGDTVDTIADSYGVAADSIIYDNQLIYPYALTIDSGIAFFAQSGENLLDEVFLIGFIADNRRDQIIIKLTGCVKRSQCEDRPCAF